MTDKLRARWVTTAFTLGALATLLFSVGAGFSYGH